MNDHRSAVPDEVRALWPGPEPERSVPLLQALHILTRTGQINQDSRRKLTQVLHLFRLIEPALARVWACVPAGETPVLADLGAGKSYLGLILYDLFLGNQPRGHLIAVEAKRALSEQAQTIASLCGFDRATFATADIAQHMIAGPASAVTALHACDTATDDAIEFALRHQARLIALVPCCQAELARQLGELSPLAMRGMPLETLWRHPLHARNFGAHLTNVIRALYLESRGYKIRVTEFTGFEHTQKNELILAERHQQSNPKAAAQLKALLKSIPVQPLRLDLRSF